MNLEAKESHLILSEPEDRKNNQVLVSPYSTRNKVTLLCKIKKNDWIRNTLIEEGKMGNERERWEWRGKVVKEKERKMRRKMETSEWKGIWSEKKIVMNETENLGNYEENAVQMLQPPDGNPIFS